MFDVFENLFAADFMPHGHCYKWQPDIVWLHAGSDALIAASYYAIPFLLIYFLHKRRDIDFPLMFVMFGAFILLCGTTHLLEIWSIWNGTYRLTGAVKLMTGAVSAATAVMLFLAVPRAIAIPSPAQLEETNDSLRAEIAARRRAETALRESEERFRGAFYLAAVGKALVASGGQWLQVNDALCELTGYAREELLELTFQDITHPDDLDEDLEQIGKMTRGELDAYQMEKRYVRKDGRVVWVHSSVSVVRTVTGPVDYFIAEVRGITGRKRWQEEQRRLLADVGAERDKLRAAERKLETTNETLRERNEDLQEFAYVASHDLREPLRKIIAFSDLLVGDCAEQLDATGKQYVDRIQNASMRMSNLLTDLLKYSRVATYTDRFRTVDLNDVLRNVIADHELAITEAGAQVTASELPTIYGDPLQMHQLFNNMIGNAVKYGREDAAPVVRVHTDSVDDAWCTLVVEDNGMGFDSKYAERIFDPFERLHGYRYEGTGMGLAICKRIVERHGGSIRAEGRPGAGARFFIRLPRTR